MANARLHNLQREIDGIQKDVKVRKALRLEPYPTFTAEFIMEVLVPEWAQLFLQKNAGYGEMHRDLGEAAQYVDIHRKVMKLRRALWEGKDIGPESTEEVIKDLIGHLFLTLELIRNTEMTADENHNAEQQTSPSNQDTSGAR